MPELIDEIDARLATRLRHERESRGWSLSDLSTRAGVSRAMINRIERGESSPTAALLGRLSGAFGLTLSALLARAEATRTGEIVRAADHPHWRDPASGYVRRQIAPAPGSNLPLDLVHVTLPDGASVTFPASAYIFVRQIVLVLDGTLALIEGERAHRLGPGDSIEFGPPLERTYRNASGGDVTYLVAVLRG